MSVKDMLNTKGLFTLTEYQQVGRRLIKVENWGNKNCQILVSLLISSPKVLLTEATNNMF